MPVEFVNLERKQHSYMRLTSMFLGFRGQMAKNRNLIHSSYRNLTVRPYVIHIIFSQILIIISLKLGM